MGLVPTILAAALVAAIWPAESAVHGSLVEALEYSDRNWLITKTQTSCSFVALPSQAGVQLWAADDARMIVAGRHRTDAKSQRYEGVLQVFDARGKVTDRWTFERRSHGQSRTVLRFTAPPEVREWRWWSIAQCVDQWMWTPAIERDRQSCRKIGRRASGRTSASKTRDRRGSYDCGCSARNRPMARRRGSRRRADQVVTARSVVYAGLLRWRVSKLIGTGWHAG